MKKGILVLCIDRDNDLGEKTGIEGPVFGRKANLEAAQKLALSDPEDSDANCMFGAIKQYDELKNAGKRVYIASLTGDSRVGVVSDEKIQEQLGAVIDEYNPKKVVIVTDGVEDEFVMPVIQSLVPVMSIKRIIVRQSLKLESNYYVALKFFKELMGDAQTRRIALGIPALVLISYALLGGIAWRLSIGLLGTFLIIKGFRLEKFLGSFANEVGSSLSRGKLSFFLYVLSAIFAIIGLVQGYDSYLTTGTDSVLSILKSVQSMLTPFLLSGLCFFTARLLFARSRGKSPFRYLTYYALAFSTYIVMDNAIAYLAFQSTITRLALAVAASFMIMIVALITDRIAMSSRSS
jgi:putative membrane protein